MANEKLKLIAQKFPQRPGIYKFKQDKQVLYVGKALSLKDRVLTYFQNLDLKAKQLTQLASNISYIETESEFQALLLEANLIKKYHPPYNIIFKDDKSYLYIFISLGEDYPKVIATRKPKNVDVSKKWEMYENLKGHFFGPYPSTSQTQELLRWLRKIFPFCSQKKISSKPCFYSHLQLCNPCPNYIQKQDKNTQPILKKIYKDNITNIKRILEEKIKNVVVDLSKKMEDLSQNQKYEEAQILKKRLFYLNNLLTVTKIKNYLTNSQFYPEAQIQITKDMTKMLNKFNLKIKQLEKIECFDISNLDGKFAVASQVVFMNGLPDKSQYKRYRIKITDEPNDVKMLSEVISRRIKHKEWPFPDIIIVDGGIPQVSTIHQLLIKENIDIHVIGLAKKKETLIIYNNDKFHQLKLSKFNNILKLIQQIRDESHRFAIKYHRHLRNKFLTNIQNIG